jgi:Insulin-induced protein (INSIG)
MAVRRGSEDSGSSLPILRPKPQRHWQITPMSTEPPTPRSPSTDPPPSAGPPGTTADDAPKAAVPRSRSILNLTASTLFGIYSSPTSDSTSSFPDISQVSTPWGHGAMTPASPQTPRESLSEDSIRPLLTAAERVKAQQPADLGMRLHGGEDGESTGRQLRNAIVLLGLGMVYGGLVAALHDEEAHAIPIRLGVLEQHPSWHVTFWGVAAASAGWVLPRFDRWWAEQQREARRTRDRAASANSPSDRRPLSTVYEGKGKPVRRNSIAADRDGPFEEQQQQRVRDAWWPGALRAMGGFVGVVFIIVSRADLKPLSRMPLTYITSAAYAGIRLCSRL